jgi:hypothetical protein
MKSPLTVLALATSLFATLGMPAEAAVPQSSTVSVRTDITLSASEKASVEYYKAALKAYRTSMDKLGKTKAGSKSASREYGRATKAWATAISLQGYAKRKIVAKYTTLVASAQSTYEAAILADSSPSATQVAIAVRDTALAQAVGFRDQGLTAVGDRLPKPVKRKR